MTEIRTTLTADISDFSKKMKRAETQADRTSSSIASSFKGAGAAIATLGAAVVGVGAAYQGLQAAAAASVGSIDNMTNQLRNTTKQLGIDTENFIAKLQESSKGMVDNLTLIREANRGLLRGLSESNVINLMGVAQQRGEQLGVSLEEAFSRLTSGVAKFERELLDELVTIDHLDIIFKKYAATLGVTTDQLTEQQKQTAVVANIMEKTSKTVADATVAYEHLRKAAVASKNTWDEIKADGFDWLDKMAGLVYKAGDAWEFMLSKLEKYKGATTGGRRGGIIGEINIPLPETNLPQPVPEGGIDTEALKQRMDANVKKVAEAEKLNLKLLQMREKWADQMVSVGKRGAEAEIAVLQDKMEKELKIVGMTEHDKATVRKIYGDKIAQILEKENEASLAKLERNLELLQREVAAEEEALAEKEEKINEFLDKERDLQLSAQERELEDLYNHYAEMWDLMDINDERRLESVKLYQERKAAIEREYREKEKSDFTTLGGSLVAAQESYDKSMETSAKDRFGMLSTFAKQTMQLGGEIGEKAFRLNQGIEIANTVVNTASAVMKVWAQGGMFAAPMAALVAATGAAQVAAIASASPGGGSSSVSAGSGSAPAASVNTNFNDLGGVTPSRRQEEDRSGTYTINIMGDIMNEDYVDLMAERISDAVQDRNVVLKASQARTIQN